MTGSAHDADREGGRGALMRTAIVSVALMILLFLASSCSGKREPESIGIKKSRKAEAAGRKTARSPLAGSAYSVLSPEVLGTTAGDAELKALRERGIMKVAVPCAREGMCMRMNYGAAVGFEVELLRRIANEGLGVKENIVAPDDVTADIRAMAECGGPGEPPAAGKSPSGNPLAGPYFYSERSGWLCFEVLRGGKPVADALDKLITHFYGTGTFQQVYRNWFPPESPDTVRRR